MKGSSLIDSLSRREGKKLNVYIRVNNILYYIPSVTRHTRYSEEKKSLNIITIDAGMVADAVSEQLATRSEKP